MASICGMRVKYFGHKASIDFEITVKPAHVVTCIKQSPVLKGHPFLVLLEKIGYELNLF